MRKSLLFLLLTCFTSGLFAQKTTPVTTTTPLNDQIKAALLRELQLSYNVADKVVQIEDELYAQVTAIKALKETPLKERAKIREAITTRRNKLAAAPLAPRQMEDAMMIVENIRRKQAGK